MKAAMIQERTTATITDIQDAATARWLTTTLAPARSRSQAAPSAEAVERMRLRIFGAPARKSKTLAA
jgi:hypothetical protein